MELMCGCLNVTVNVQESSPSRPIDMESLRQEDQEDPFEGCCLREMDLEISGICIENTSLVSERLYGDLKVFKCHSCKMVTHTLHRHKVGRLFVNSALIKDASTIAELRQSQHYSKVFRLVLPPDYKADFPDVMNLQRSAESSVSQAQQILDAFVMAEEAAVQARIQAFMEEQHVILARTKQRAQQDLRSMYSVMSSMPRSESRPTKTEAIPTGQSIGRPGLGYVESTSSQSQSAPVRQSNFHVTDDIFCMDDLELADHDAKPAYVSDDEDDDTSTDNSFQGSQTGLAMPSTMTSYTASSDSPNSSMLGKSAPIAMPVRLHTPSNPVACDLTPSFQDIGNSIKALAQSVQDQSTLLFGELPRPRTATSFINTVS